MADFHEREDPMGDWKPHVRRRRRRRDRGTVRVLEDFRTADGEERALVVYLPPGHGEGERRYPVVYMQDGQNLFGPDMAFADPWRVHDAMDWLARRGVEAIVVGIANAEEGRFEEYSPFADPEHGGGEGDRYLDLVLGPVKERVDADFRTRPGPEDTGMVGSSLGGLIALYAFFRHPGRLGFVGALSPALWFGGGEIFDYVEAAGAPEGRLYLDAGTAEGEGVVRDVRRMTGLLAAKGYEPGLDLVSLTERGGRHEETAWGRRLPGALVFLLPEGARG